MVVVVLPGERSAGHGGAPLRARTRTRPMPDRKHGHTSWSTRARNDNFTMGGVEGQWSLVSSGAPPRSPPTEPRPSHRTLIHQCPATRKGKPGPGQPVVCTVCCLYCLLSVLSVATVLSRMKFKDVSQQVSHSPAPTPTLAHRHNLV